MVTTDKDFQSYKDNDKPCTFYGLSTDDKPTTMTVNERVFDVVGGSAFVEIDTGGIYMYDEENQEWYQMNSGSGGGGGGGSSTLIGLTDVDISNPTDGQKLVYDASTCKWKNDDCNCNSVLVVNVIYDEVDDFYVMDKTAAEVMDAFPNVKLILDTGEGEYSVGSITAFYYESNEYYFLVKVVNEEMFFADSSNSYPHSAGTPV